MSQHKTILNLFLRKRESKIPIKIELAITSIFLLVMFGTMLVFIVFRCEWRAFVHSIFPPFWAEIVRGGIPPLIGGVPAIMLQAWLRKLVANKVNTADRLRSG